MTDRLRVWQLRRGPEGDVRVLRIGTDSVLLREEWCGDKAVYEPTDARQRFPEVVERSSLERMEAKTDG